MLKEKIIRSIRRKKRVRSKIRVSLKYPRLCVFRSSKHIYAQIIDDRKATTLVSASDIELSKDTNGSQKKEKSISQTKTEKAFAVGELIAKKALKKNIKKVVFDRGSYRYHGRVKALADGARKGGLEF